MTAKRLRWSWPGVLIACLAIGVLTVGGAYAVQSFRRGLDADLGPMLWQASPLELAAEMAMLGLVALPFVVLALALANRSRAPVKWFVVLLVATPTALYFASQLFWIVQAALEPPMNIAPFEANDLFYLPNWLQLGFIALSFLIAAAVYVRIALDAKRP